MNAPRSFDLGVRPLAFFVIGVVQLWHVSLSLFGGKEFSYLSALSAFFLMHGHYICLILTAFLVWVYFSLPCQSHNSSGNSKHSKGNL